MTFVVVFLGDKGRGVDEVYGPFESEADAAAWVGKECPPDEYGPIVSDSDWEVLPLSPTEEARA